MKAFFDPFFLQTRKFKSVFFGSKGRNGKVHGSIAFDLEEVAAGAAVVADVERDGLIGEDEKFLWR